MADDPHSDGCASTLSADGTPADPTGALHPGTLIADRYLLERVIGHGGMGHVYQVRDLELDRQIALKTLRHAPTGDRPRRFRREVQLALRITHPNVVRLFDLGTWMGANFLTMELVGGQSLRQRLSAGPLPIATASEIGRQVAAALTAAHDAGVIHRDLKPENILLDENRVVVVDFGVAGEETERREASAIVGTSEYMSPEQANGLAATPAVDLYALGLVLYEMLVGEVPLVGAGPVATALRRERERPAAPRTQRSDIPEPLDRLVLQLLERDPAKRPASASAVEDELASWAQPLSTITETAPIPVTATRPNRRPWLRIAAGGALVTAAILAGLSLWPSHHPRGDPHARFLLAVDPTVEATLSPEFEFLRPTLADAVFRALATRLPGRVAREARDAPDSPRITAQVTGTAANFTVALEIADRRFSGRAAYPAEALDQAATRLVAAVIPADLPATPEELAAQQAWHAPSLAVVRELRQTEVALARLHMGQTDRLIRLVGPGFVRPFIMAIWDDPAIGLEDDPRVDTARANAATAPAGERLLLEAYISLANTQIGPSDQLAADSRDPWVQAARTWGLAYQGKRLEALALTNRVTDDFELAGLGLALAQRIAWFYAPSRLPAATRTLVEALPEEPGPWSLLAQSELYRSSDPGEAAVALERARILGADPAALAPVEAGLAFRRFDLDRATSIAMRLVGDQDVALRLLGVRLLYGVDAMRGLPSARKYVDQMSVLALAGRPEQSVTTFLGLASDSLFAGDVSLAHTFATVAAELAAAAHDCEFAAMAASFLAATDRVSGTLDADGFARRLEEIATDLRAERHDPDRLVALPNARFAVVVADRRCDEIAEVARSLDPGVIPAVALARCDLERGDPAGALARLDKLVGDVLELDLPNVTVERELLLGQALVQLGQPEQARPHLQRVVDLRRSAVDRRAVGAAQSLLVQ